MASLASINVKFNVDLSDFSSQMQNSLRSIDKWGQKLQSVGRNLTAAVTLPVLAAGAAATKMASDYEESVNKVDVAFKTASPTVREFAKTTLETSGIAEGTALDMSANFGDMATSMGLPVTAAAKMSTSLVALAGDLASFKNIGIDQANTALNGIFSGETESLKMLGVVMTEANLQQYAYSQGIKAKVKDLDQASKVQLRYNYILSVTKNAQGDFARTQGGAANQSRIFTESLKQLGQQFGSIILPLFTKVITSINSGIKSFSNLSEGTKTVVVVVAGLAAAIGPLLLGVGALLALVPSVVAGFIAVKTAVIGLQGSLVTIAAGLTVAFALYEIFSTVNEKAAIKVKELSNAQKLQKQITDDATNSIMAQKAELASFLAIANDETKSKKERLAAIKAINKISPEYLGNINLENIGTDKARVAIEKYNEALLKGAKAKAAQQVLQELYKKEIETAIQREKAEANKNKLLDEANKKQFTSAAAQKQYNDLLNDKSGVLKTLREQEDKDVKSQIDVAAKIYNQGKDYLDLLGDIGGQTAYNSSLGKDDKTKLNPGTIAFYESQIEALQKQQKEVVKTSDEYKNLERQIVSVQSKIKNIESPAVGIKKPEFPTADNSDISIPDISIGQLKGQLEYFEKLQSTLPETSDEYKRYAEAINGTKIQIAKIEGVDEIGSFSSKLSDAAQKTDEIRGVLENSLKGLASSLAAGVGESIGALVTGTENIGGVLRGMLGIVADFMGQLGKQLIAVGVAGIALKKAFSNPFAALAAGVALVALSAIAQATMQKGPAVQKFANGGIVGGSSYYGDKILARVNSKEMISNTDQQKAIWNGLNAPSGGIVTIIPEIKMKGSDMIIWFNRANDRKNRIG